LSVEASARQNSFRTTRRLTGGIARIDDAIQALMASRLT
jgi:hypothetical protein